MGMRNPGLLVIFILVSSFQVSADELTGLKNSAQQIGSPGQLQIQLALLDRQITLAAKDTDSERFVELADSYGNLVVSAREISVEKRVFEQLKVMGERLHKVCRDRVRLLEEMTGEDEGKLEDLYRSRLWYRINYALSSYRYWQAWIDLGIAEQLAGTSERLTWLTHAESGFRAISVRILYPGLVYGSTLGLGYAALARGDAKLAEDRFRLLKKALMSDPDNQLHETIDTELKILALRQGKLVPVDVEDDLPLTPVRARMMGEEAFALLEQQRRIEEGAIAAAKRLKILLGSEFLSNDLVSRLMTYKEEIAGHDIGPLGILVDAEYAYAYNQFETTVFKFREFLSVEGALPAAALTTEMELYRYHYAVSLEKISLHRDALHQIEILKDVKIPHQSLMQPLSKLHFIVSQSLYQAQSNEPNNQRLAETASRFIALSPDDADVSHAHLALARIVEDKNQRDQHLAKAKSDSRLKDEIALVLLQSEIKGFNHAVSSGDSDQQLKSATSVLKLLAEMPRKQRKLVRMKVLAIQMRTAKKEDPEKLLKAIEVIESEGGYEEETGRLLLWSKLRALDLLETPDRLREFVGELALKPQQVVIDQGIFMFLLEQEAKANYTLVADLCAIYSPALIDQPGDLRQMLLIRIRALTRSGQLAEAFQQSQQMIEQFPGSGDAWIVYAQSAEILDHLFEAERGWAKITRAVPQGSDRWLEGMMKRVDLSIRLKKKSSDNCGLIYKIDKYKHRLTKDSLQDLKLWKSEYNCQLETTNGA